ncbi:ABC transporter permease [Virgibacillus siamensis]|uniref:ABC transporter permease n=1 Tax=Virgibacillus siamensis TaxID=480071 RepID=UPI000985B6AB|nr:ABC transporter permease [Virgibacillus siamensis]
MILLKQFFLFLQHDFRKLKRKWISLPLLLLFPIFIMSLCAIIAVAVFSPDKEDPIVVGLVDLDQSKETKMVTKMIEGSSQLGNYIQIEKLTREQAAQHIKNKLSAYITFPDGFTEDLYNGTSVTLQVTGNRNKQTESYVIKELLDSIARHIRTSQANILTVNYYAKQLSISESKRHDLLFKQFTNFLLYTVGKDKIVDETKITNDATSASLQYYILSGWIVVVTIWLLGFYSFFSGEDELLLKQRMRLYGVIFLVQLLAKMVISFVVTGILAAAMLYICTTFMNITLYGDDLIRIAIITGLYCLTFLTTLAIIETLIVSPKIRLLIQSLFTVMTLLATGAILPSLYFPFYIQSFLPYIFAYESFYWLREILLNDRLYAEYIPLLLMTSAVLFLLLGLSLWKERRYL